MPSIPGAPLLRRTCFNARSRLFLSKTRLSRPALKAPRLFRPQDPLFGLVFGFLKGLYWVNYRSKAHFKLIGSSPLDSRLWTSKAVDHMLSERPLKAASL